MLRDRSSHFACDGSRRGSRQWQAAWILARGRREQQRFLGGAGAGDGAGLARRGAGVRCWVSRACPVANGHGHGRAMGLWNEYAHRNASCMRDPCLCARLAASPKRRPRPDSTLCTHRRAARERERAGQSERARPFSHCSRRRRPLTSVRPVRCDDSRKLPQELGGPACSARTTAAMRASRNQQHLG